MSELHPATLLHDKGDAVRAACTNDDLVDHVAAQYRVSRFLSLRGSRRTRVAEKRGEIPPYGKTARTHYALINAFTIASCQFSAVVANILQRIEIEFKSNVLAIICQSGITSCFVARI